MGNRSKRVCEQSRYIPAAQSATLTNANSKTSPTDFEPVSSKSSATHFGNGFEIPETGDEETDLASRKFQSPVGQICTFRASPEMPALFKTTKIHVKSYSCVVGQVKLELLLCLTEDAERRKNIPIIAITAFAMKGDQAKIHQGASIARPISRRRSRSARNCAEASEPVCASTLVDPHHA